MECSTVSSSDAMRGTSYLVLGQRSKKVHVGPLASLAALETAASTSPANFKFVSTRLHVLQYFNIYQF